MGDSSKDVEMTEKAKPTTATAPGALATGDGLKPGDQPNIFKLLWPAYMCAFVDFLGAGIAIPILPYYMLELPWEEGTKCPTCPQAPGFNNTLTGGACGEVSVCGTSIEVGL